MVNVQRVHRIRVLIYCFLTFAFFAPLVLIVTLFFKILHMEQSVYAYIQEQASVSQPEPGVDRYVLEPPSVASAPDPSVRTEDPAASEPNTLPADSVEDSPDTTEPMQGSVGADETVPDISKEFAAPPEGNGVSSQPAPLPENPDDGTQPPSFENLMSEHPFTGA